MHAHAKKELLIPQCAIAWRIVLRVAPDVTGRDSRVSQRWYHPGSRGIFPLLSIPANAMELRMVHVRQPVSTGSVFT